MKWTKLIKAAKSLSEIEQEIKQDIKEGNISKEDILSFEDYDRIAGKWYIPEFSSKEELIDWALKNNLFTDYALNQLKQEIISSIGEIIENNLK